MKKQLLRSVLFCPGNREKVLLKSLTLPADCFVYDLEDAVSPKEKANARNIVNQFASTHLSSLRASCVVRVNCPRTTEWGSDDLTAVAQLPAVDAIVLPKVEDQSIIDQANEIIQKHRPSELPPLPIWTMIETPKGVLNSYDIAKHPLVHCLVFGSNDLTKELRAKHTFSREPLLFSMSQCILAARAERKRVLDGVHINLTDDVGLAASCEQGRNLGFDGKTLIHPNQVLVANDAYSPSSEEVQSALEIVAAWEAASTDGKGGVISLNGKMIEYLHVEQAMIVISEAKEIGII
jgi:citrate lyase beta subunit